MLSIMNICYVEYYQNITLSMPMVSVLKYYAKFRKRCENKFFAQFSLAKSLQMEITQKIYSIPRIPQNSLSIYKCLYMLLKM